MARRENLRLYKAADLPDTMATRNMLARMRRKLADGQEPVATYKGRYADTDLYLIADSVELPPMTAKQQARWDAARTCSRCGKTSAEPMPQWGTGRRLDDQCRAAERLAEVRVSHLALRLAASEWARGVLADPAAAVLVADPVTGWTGRNPVDVYAATLSGEPLVDMLVWPSVCDGLSWPYSHPSVLMKSGVRLMRPAYAVDDNRIIPHLYPLVGRRMIHLVLGSWNYDMVSPFYLLGDVGHTWSQFDGSLYAGGSIRQAPEDCFSRRWRHWLCRPSGGNPWSGEHGLAYEPIEAEWASQAAAAIVAGLHWMADDDHPDGPATCPALPPTGLEPCGNPELKPAGMCERHAAEPAGGDRDV